MYIGACTFILHLPDCHDLKQKRQVIRSLLGQIQQHFHVAVSEVDHQDSWQLSSIGIACVGPTRVPLDRVINQIINFIQSRQGDFILTDHVPNIFLA